MLNISDEQKKYIYDEYQGSITINGKKYFFKPMNTSSPYGVEMFVEELAKLINIKCPHYEAIEINGINFYLSEDIAYNNQFITARGISINRNSLYDIWDILEKKYPQKVEYLMQQIVKIYIFDILLLNDDRNLENYGFKIVNEDIVDTYILDNEFCFSYGITILTSRFINSLNSISNSLDDLNNFLKTSSEEFSTLLKNILDILTPKKVFEVLNSSKFKKMKYKEKISIINIYKENYNSIKQLLENNSLKK